MVLSLQTRRSVFNKIMKLNQRKVGSDGNPRPGSRFITLEIESNTFNKNWFIQKR